MGKHKKWTWKKQQNKFWFPSSLLCSEETQKENLIDENFAASIKDGKSWWSQLHFQEKKNEPFLLAQMKFTEVKHSLKATLPVETTLEAAVWLKVYFSV